MATKDAAAANRRAAAEHTRTSNEGTLARNRLPVIAGVVVLLAAVVAIAVSVAGDGGSRPSAIEDDAVPVEVAGSSIPSLPDAGEDPAIGQPFPTLSGTGIDGEPVAIEPGESPLIVVYLAHWCPVCQDEVPVLVDWLEGGGAGDVEVVAVATDLDPARGNWPASTWLLDEGWAQPTLIDPDGAAGSAGGKRAVPYFVALDAAGDVVLRATGALNPSQLDALAELAAGA